MTKARALANVNILFNPKTTSYTLIADDLLKFVTMNSASATTITIPSGVFVPGDYVNIQQIGTGQVTVQGNGTSTFTGVGTKLRTQNSSATIICTGTNTFTLIGDIV